MSDQKVSSRGTIIVFIIFLLILGGIYHDRLIPMGRTALQTVYLLPADSSEKPVHSTQNWSSPSPESYGQADHYAGGSATPSPSQQFVPPASSNVYSQQNPNPDYGSGIAPAVVSQNLFPDSHYRLLAEAAIRIIEQQMDDRYRRLRGTGGHNFTRDQSGDFWRRAQIHQMSLVGENQTRIVLDVRYKCIWNNNTVDYSLKRLTFDYRIDDWYLTGVN